MFYHDMKYVIISSFKSKYLIVWIILFPITLGLFFKIAFGDVYSENIKTSPVPTAVVEQSENEVFHSVMQTLDDSQDKFLDVTFTDESSALSLLKGGKVSGIIYYNGAVSLTVAKSGLEETMLTEFINQYNLQQKILTDAAKDPASAKAVISELSKQREPAKIINVTRGNTDVFISYFYNLIAMTALYGAILGLNVCIKNQANLSALGARKNCSPVPKTVSLAANICAGFIIQSVCMVVCVTFLAFVLRVDFGDRLALVYIASIIGGWVGVSLGFFVGSVGKAGERIKLGILMSFIMLLCFLSGLMIGDMKSVIAQKAPWFNEINPAAVISDSIYCLNIYYDYDRFILKLVTMLATCMIFSAMGIFFTRRERYASL